MRKVIAILCADLHLSLKPPVARAGEPDWLAAQARPLKELAGLSQDNDQAPILCAGDVLDRWNSPPELINWAIENLPVVYAVPGQHDLPFHSLDLIEKSAYMTLVKAGRIVTLSPGELHGIKDVKVGAFPWGVPLKEVPQNLLQNPYKKPKCVKVALLHKHIWIKGYSFPGAPKDFQLGDSVEGMDGWDVLVYGDNHKGFKVLRGETSIFNCGTFMRRKSDEIEYKPQVGLLFEDGEVVPHYLNTSADSITETESRNLVGEDMELKEFLEELSKLQDSCLDFEEAMKQVLEERKPRPAVRTLILKAMEENHGNE